MKTSNRIVFPAVSLLTGGVLYFTVKRVCQRDRALFYAISRLLECLQERPVSNVRAIRSAFQKEAMPSADLVEGHSHAIAARDRNIGGIFCRLIAARLNKPAYSYQMSASDQYHKVNGYRDWRWGKDIPVSPSNSIEQGLTYMVDVDYYVDMGRYLAGRSEPLLCYTTQPSKVAVSEGDTAHYFTEDNELVTHVSGGAKYSHMIWDYNCDSVMAVKRGFFGIPYCVTHYLVDQRHVTSEKKLVMFTPAGTWTGLSSLLALWWIKGSELTHLKPVSNGWATLYSQSPKGLNVSIGRAGTYGEATVSAITLERMFAADRLSKQNANVGSVASWAASDRTVGVIIADYIRCNKGIKAPYVANIASGVIGYSADLTGDDNDKSTIVPYMPALVSGGCFAPAQDGKTTTWGVESRVTNLNQIRSLEINDKQRALARNFVKRVINNGKLCPVEFQVVWDNQTRTTQRSILEEASVTGEVTDDTIKSFMKREAYAKVGTPRVISTLPGLTKLEYSQYTLAASKHIKEFNWYAFRKPVEIATRVAEIVMGQDLVAETDFSRMDGHVTAEVRTLIEEAIMKGLFGNDKYMLSLMREQYNKPGQLGAKRYETGYARASGSPETSLFNTILTAFISFSAMVELGLTEDKAWESLGVYGGDDGLVAIPSQYTAAQAERSYRLAAESWGQVLKLDFKVRDEPVQFLARFYGEAWTGGMDSMSDVKRQLVKFHTTICIPDGMSNEQKARDKAVAILLTDKNTPILGEFAKKVSTVRVKKTVHNHDQDFRLVSHWAKFEKEDQFPNEYGNWMEDVIAAQMPDFDHEVFKTWLRSGDPMRPPQCLDITPEFYTPEVTCIINDDVAEGTGIKPSKAKQASPEVKKTQTKKQASPEIKQVQQRKTVRSTQFNKVKQIVKPSKGNNQSKKQQQPTEENVSKTEEIASVLPTKQKKRGYYCPKTRRVVYKTQKPKTSTDKSGQTNK